MAKPLSALNRWVGRLVKAVIGVALIPPVIGLALGASGQLELVFAGSRSFAEWSVIGALSYVGVHLLFYKPTALFGVQHRMLSRLSSWLFGGQVSTVTPKGERKGARDKTASGAAQGSTLLVLSPYLVPLSTILVCLMSWALHRWWVAWWLDAATAVLVGATLAMHWVMTADELQQNRQRFPLDVYLPSLGLIGILSLLIVSAALPMAAPAFSLPGALAEAMAQAGAIYSAVFRALFL